MRRLMKRTALVFPLFVFAACGPDAKPIDVQLAPPDNGFQLTTDPIEVPRGKEIQACFFYKVPDINNGQPYFVDRIEVAQNPGSHHMNLFRQKTIVNLKGPNADGTGVVISEDGTGECFKSANWSDWPLVVNSQEGSTENKNYVLSLPDHVAFKFTPGEVLMLQSHYVNASTQKTPGRAKVIVNFEKTDASDTMEVGTLFATQQSISICRDNPTPTFSGFCKINSHDQPVTIFAANGHFHSRGMRFTIGTWNGMNQDATAGTQFYDSHSWDDPPMSVGLDVPVPSGGGVAWTCSYQWQPSPGCADGCSCLQGGDHCCYSFSGIVETGEHCNAFIYYYPKIDSTDIICH